MERADCLPPKSLRVPGKAIHHCRRHGDAGANGQGAEDKDDGEIGNLLQGVVAVKPVGLRRQMECRVVYPGVPCLQQHQRRSGHDPPPLLGIEEHDDEENARDDEAVNVDEVPNPRNADGVPVTRCANDRRNVAGIVLRGPDAVARNLERRKPDPLAARRAVIVEIETRMIDQDRQAAANQHRHKKEIEEVAVTHPERKAVRPGEVVGIYLGDRRNMRQAGSRQTQSRTREPRQNHHCDSDQNGRANPNAEAAVLWVVHCRVRGIEGNHS